jgi:hypothetical protein
LSTQPAAMRACHFPISLTMPFDASVSPILLSRIPPRAAGASQARVTGDVHLDNRARVFRAMLIGSTRRDHSLARFRALRGARCGPPVGATSRQGRVRLRGASDLGPVAPVQRKIIDGRAHCSPGFRLAA